MPRPRPRLAAWLVPLGALAGGAGSPRLTAASPTFALASTGLPPSNAGHNCSLNSGGWVGVALGDVDGDGDDDLAAVGRLLVGLHAWRSDGGGGWTETSSGLDGDCHGRSDLELGDVDRDGRLDLGAVGGINGAPVVYRGDGGTGWTASSGGLAAGNGEGFTFGDFDGDGWLDLAVAGHFSGGVHAWFGDGSGTWSERSTGLPATTGGHRITAGDLDGDGDAELVVSQFEPPDNPPVDGVFVWSYDRALGWSVAWSAYFNQPYGVAIDDADGDGMPDLFVSAAQDQVGTRGSVHVFLNQGDGRSFVEASTGLPVATAYLGDMATGDLDADGDADVVVGDWSGIVSVFLNDGSSRWTPAAGTGLPAGADKTEGVAVGDLDGDCRLDLAFALYTAGVRAYRNTTPGSCAVRAEAGPPQQACAGPVTLDGSRSRACGCARAELRYRWLEGTTLLRDWAPDAAHTLASAPAVATTYRLEVACVQDLTCIASDATAVVPGSGGAAPGALGNVLKLVKTVPPEIAFGWTDLAAAGIAGYQVLALPDALGPPTQAAFDAGPATTCASAPPGIERATLGDGLVNPPGLVHFRVRAVGACSSLPGPA